MNFVMNEEEYAKMLLGGDSAIDLKSRTYAVTVIAKYYRSLGYGDKTVGNCVETFVTGRFTDAPRKSVDFWEIGRAHV